MPCCYYLVEEGKPLRFCGTLSKPYMVRGLEMKPRIMDYCPFHAEEVEESGLIVLPTGFSSLSQVNENEDEKREWR